jgi:hypothetical protein
MIDLASQLFFQQTEHASMQETCFHELEREEGFYFDEKERVVYLLIDDKGISESTLCLLHERDCVYSLILAGLKFHEEKRLEREKDGLIRKLKTVEELISCLREEEGVKFPFLKFEDESSSRLIFRSVKLREEENIFKEVLDWLDEKDDHAEKVLDEMMSRRK